MAKHIGALDLGTTSDRFIAFDHQGRIIGFYEMEHEQILPRPGLQWVSGPIVTNSGTSGRSTEPGSRRWIRPSRKKELMTGKRPWQERLTG